MVCQRFYISLFTIVFLQYGLIHGQKVELNGQVAGWFSVNNTGGTSIQTGARYIPQLLYNIPLGKRYKLDGELSADSYLNYTKPGDTTGYTGSGAILYRFWLRFSGDRFELRAGLQKINFGSASMLRPLMWFDRVDPRDPLKLTTGVYGLLGKYYFRNNANIWLWSLIGNKSTKGWESVASRSSRPETGGRIQLPVPRGEIAFTYNNRMAVFPADWSPPLTGKRTFVEDRAGLDTKLDLGVGIWAEGTVTHRSTPDLASYEKALTIGMDYTFKVGEGLNMIAEHMIIDDSQKFFSSDKNISFTGLSVSLPLSVITRTGVIIFYDWKNNYWYRFGSLSFTFDNFIINCMGFWNPRTFSIFNYDNGFNMMAGAGGQVMVVFNY